MANPLKRLLNPAEEENYIDFNEYSSTTSADYSLSSYQPDSQSSFSLLGAPRWSAFLGPGYGNPASEIPSIQPMNSISDLFGDILHDPTISSQMSLMNITGPDYNLDGALTEWGTSTQSPCSSDQLQLTPGPSQDRSYETSLTPGSSQPPDETAHTPHGGLLDDGETVCYGMLHNVEVKLIGTMQDINDKLSTSESAYERFRLEEQENHVVLCFRDDSTNFGYLRSGVGRSLMRVIKNPAVELEPIAPVSNLRDTIGRANKATEAMVKVDINIYGSKSIAAATGELLSKDKLWLQEPDHARQGVHFDNPHFFPIKINGVQMETIQPVNQTVKDGASRAKLRNDQLRKMVEEIYKSVDNTRGLDRVEGGHRVASSLLRHQQEALGFMMERESGHINERFRLWEEVSEQGRTIYRHKITRARREVRPDERGGGILADEMGMGKSLSILALIMKTLDDGTEWAQQKNDAAEGKKTPKYSRSTLVVVSSALLIYNWVNEIDIHLKRGLRVFKYHGANRIKDVETIQNSDIVITTYNTLTSEYQNKSVPSCLHQIGWYRVVLDEAHIIRRPTTMFHHACADLHGNSRWCLTGTPVQNKLADIGALFTFIRVEPFSKTSVFRKWIELPFEQNVESITKVKDRLVMLLEALCLRRTKDIIALPELRQYTRTLEFSPAEREQYDKTKKILMRTISQRVGEVQKSSKFGLFQANLQMRILCNHGTFQKPFSWHRLSYQDEIEAVVNAIGGNGQIICSGCQQPMPILGSSHQGNGFIENCAHVICSECIEESSTRNNGEVLNHCPVCISWRVRVQADDGPSAPVQVTMDGISSKNMAEDDDDYYFNWEGHSTKMLAVIEDVQKDLYKTKSIIFSCWTRTLRLLARYLEKASIPYLGIDGGCPLRQRQAKLDQFAKDTKTPVLIMTTGTGAFGLNLTCANRVFIVELQWNPAVENQAIARAIRLGQRDKVHVTRYVIKNTVEEEMRTQQKSKKLIAALGFEEEPDEVEDDGLNVK